MYFLMVSGRNFDKQKTRHEKRQNDSHILLEKYISLGSLTGEGKLINNRQI